MPLKLQLGCYLPGKELIEIVDSSMDGINDWKRFTKKNSHHQEFYVRPLGVNFLRLNSLIRDSYFDNSFKFDHYSGCFNSTKLIGIKRKPLNGILTNYAGLIFNFSMGIFDMWDSYGEEKKSIFCTNDSIFTFIDPNYDQNELLFYLNLGYDGIKSPHLGSLFKGCVEENPFDEKKGPDLHIVKKYDSIMNTYSGLCARIHDKIDKNASYRTFG